jgi:hypothetical protein
MENLIYGVFIGFLFAESLLLAAAVYYLYRKFNLLNLKVKSDNEAFTKMRDDLFDWKRDYNTDKLNIHEVFDKHNDRLKKLESIEVPEHLTFTEEMVIQAEVEKRLALKNDFSDSNFLEDVRSKRLAEHNRLHHKDA